MVGGADADALARLVHSCGKSYRDLLRLRLREVSAAPDLVLYPRSDPEIRAVLAFCSERQIGVIPFGGGTSVVGGVEVTDPRPHVSLDLGNMQRLFAIDGVSLTATMEAGVRGPQLEAWLAASGMTAGHFPQSFEFSTLGGWLATRATGAFSNRYGKIEDLVVVLRLIAPAGVHELRGRPRHAMGPDLMSLAVGSEGTLGVISRATIRVHRQPEARRFETVLFHGFAEGLDALRAMAQDGASADLAYLDDEDETRLSVAGAGGAAGAAKTLLKARGVSLDRAALCYLGYEGAKEGVSHRFAVGKRYWRSGVAVGGKYVARWLTSRYVAPYVRDSLIERRVMVDTVETAATWADVPRVHEAVRKAFLDCEAAGWIGCHMSHIYSEGASLYFTFMALQHRGEEIAQYDAAKGATTRAILDAGGHLSHHHGIGSEHARYFREAIGDENWRLLRELKRTLDPTGIMNPGKLFVGGG
jgi:alkyldihydroxyacetonephosphate synthase